MPRKLSFPRRRESIKLFPTLLTLIVLFAVAFVVKTIFVSKNNSPKIKKSPTGSSYLFETGNEIFSAKIGTKDHTAPYLIFNNRDQSSVSFSLKNASSEKISERQNQIIFQNAKENTDFIYTSIPTGIKEEIIIKQATVSANYIFTLTTSNAKPRPIGSSAYSRFFFDENNNYQFHILEPFAVDAKGIRTEDVSLSIRKSSSNENVYELLLTVSPAWLSAKDRAYPVSIDPTVVHDTGTEFAAGILNRVKDTGSESFPSLESFYQELPADEATVGLWHLNETAENTCSGGVDACDSSGYGGHLTATGTTITTSTQRLGAAARSFNGTTDYLNKTVAANSPLDIDANAVSIEAWIKPSGIAATHGIVTRGQAATNGYGMQIGAVTVGRLNLGGQGGGNIDGRTALTTGRWYHVAGVIEGNNSRLYLDGELEAIGTVNVLASAGDFKIGANFDGASAYRFFNGLIDEVRVSNVSRSAEEIRLAAQRRPYSTFTSSVIDLTYKVGSFNSLSWNELGVTTGDGETLKDTTSLYAQWNLNETSGTTATNNAGSCGATCNGTLNLFASTGSQDAAPISGWTSNHRRWGAGALMFDGSNDYVSFSNIFDALTSATFEIWLNYRGSFATNEVFFASVKDTNNRIPIFVSATTRKFTFENIVATVNRSISSDMVVEPGKWYHLAFMCGTGGMKMYVNGVKQTSTNATTDCHSTIAASTSVNIGAHASTAPFPGVIDSTRMYSRILTDAEIMSNYNAGNIELQTRVGSDNSPDDGNWEEWRPITNESVVETFDHTQSSLVSYWPLVEYSGTNVKDWQGSNNGTTTNATIIPSIFGNALQFAGTGYVNVPDNATLDLTGDFTLMAWVYRTGGTNGYIISKFDTSGSGGYALLHGNTGEVYCRTDNGTSYTDSYTGGGYVTTTSRWVHVAIVREGSACRVYVNGVNQTTTEGTHTTLAANNQPLKIGANASGTSDLFNGYIDEVRVYNSALSLTEMFFVRGGPSNIFTFFPLPDTALKYEGSAAQKFTLGKINHDISTSSLWHLDETSGTGAYLKDSTANAHHGTPTGTAVIDGVSQKARSFDGNDYIDVGDVGVTEGSAFTVDFWAKTNATNATPIVYSEGTPADWANNLFIIYYGDSGYSGGLRIWYRDGSVGGSIITYSGTNVVDNQWHHVAFVQSAADNRVLYLDGVPAASDSVTRNVLSVTNAYIGAGNNNGTITQYFNGSIDEVRTSNIARSPEEIANIYRLGRDQYFQKVIPAANYSAINTFAFNVAANRPGTYLTATIGESEFANNLVDTNTVGFWRFDEGFTENATVLKFASTNSNEANSYSYYEAAAGGGVVVATNDTFEFDVYIATNVDGIGALDIRYSDATYARQFTWTDQNAVTCNTNNTTYLNQWFRRKCTVPAAANGKTVSWIDLVNENNTNTATVAYYDNIVIRDSTGAIKGVYYSQGTPTLNTLDFESNAANTQTLTVTNTTSEGIAVSWPYSNFFLRDISGSNLNAVSINAVLPVSGKFGYGRYFSADTDKLITSTTSILDDDTHTIDFWLKFNQTTDASYRQIFAYRPAGSDRSPSIWDNPTNHCLHWRFDPGNTGPTSCGGPNGENTYFTNGLWYHIAGVKNGATFNFYVNGQLIESGSVVATKTSGSAPLEWGQTSFNAAYVTLDEFRISNSVRTVDEIRQTYEVGLRAHPITIDFAAALNSGNLITGSSDLSFTVDATAYGLFYMGDKLFKGDKIIVRENVNGTEYIAQGTVTAVTLATGAVTIANWDFGSTFPSGGYTTGAEIFKWQRELWNITEPLDAHLDAITQFTFRSTDGNEGRTVWLDDLRSNTDYLTTPAGSTITSSTGNRYFQYRALFQSFDENVSATLSAVTVNYTENASPGIPTLDSPTNGATGVIFSPQLKTTATDTNGDYIRYKIELCTNAAMTTGCSTFDQTASQTGWSGQNTESGTAYTSGTQATYTVQVPLSENSVYYWRSYAIDPGGRNEFGSTQASPFSFTTSIRPNVPTLDSPANGATNISTSAVLRTTGTDNDNDYLRYKIEICTNDAMTLNCQTYNQTVSQTGWSAQDTQSGTAYTSGTQAVYTVQSPLQLSTTYHWRSYAIDPGGANIFGGTQATPFSFTTVSAPPQPSQCFAVKATDNSQIVVTWTDNATNEDGYQIWRVVNGGAPSQLGPNLAPNTVTYTDTAVSNNNSYGYLIRSFQIIDSVTYYSAFCSTATIHLAEGNFRFEGIQFN